MMLSDILLSVDEVGDEIDATSTRGEEGVNIHLGYSLYSDVA